MDKKALRALSIFSLTMITVGSVDSIRNLPMTALFGSQLIVFFFIGALFFLLPTALVSAELAATWPEQGGVYVWLKEAFGKKAGFLAIWLQWVENVIWYPLLLMFVAGSVGYLIAPQLANEPYFLWAVIVSAFWIVTLINYCGMKASAFFSNLCTVCGLLLPMLLIIGLGGFWVFGGNPIQIQFDLKHMLPEWHNPGLLASLTAIIMSFCGVEIATVHAHDVENPQRSFPKALAYSVLIILSTLILGSLAIAVVLPAKDINLVAGIMQASHAFFEKYHALWLMPWIAGMLVLGGLGAVNNWIIAPTKGLLVGAQDGNMPAYFRRVNQQGAPVTLLFIQAVLVTLSATLLLFFPSVNGSYWFLTALAAQLYMMMYMMMFAAILKLRRTYPKKRSAFRIPGGWFGLLLVCGMGFCGTVTTFCISFVAPDGVDVGNIWVYRGLLILGLLLMSLPPFILNHVSQKRAQALILEAEVA